jgi:septal ring factor EnvC (AmiA/AmiB activator)
MSNTNYDREFGKLETEVQELKEDVDELRQTVAQTNTELREVKAELARYRETNIAVTQALQSVATFLRFAKWLAALIVALAGVREAVKQLGWWK